MPKSQKPSEFEVFCFRDRLPVDLGGAGSAHTGLPWSATAGTQLAKHYIKCVQKVHALIQFYYSTTLSTQISNLCSPSYTNRPFGTARLYIKAATRTTTHTTWHTTLANTVHHGRSRSQVTRRLRSTANSSPLRSSRTRPSPRASVPRIVASSASALQNLFVFLRWHGLVASSREPA